MALNVLICITKNIRRSKDMSEQRNFTTLTSQLLKSVLMYGQKSGVDMVKQTNSLEMDAV